MNTILPLVLPFVTGWLLIEALLGNEAVPNRRLLTLSLAVPAGLGLTSVFLFLCYLCLPRMAYPVTTAMLTAVSLASLHRLKITGMGSRNPEIEGIAARVRGKIKMAFGKEAKWQQTLFFLAELAAAAGALFFLYSFLRSFAAGTIQAPYGEWDARLFWNVKAKFMVRNPEEWKAMFSPLLDWAHPDYPLLIPGAAAWGWLASGHEMSFWPAWVSLAFALSGLIVIFWALYSFHGFLPAAASAALLLSTQTFVYWGRAQMADIPLFCLITGTIILLRQGLMSRSSGMLAVSLLLAGLCAWTKNEGLLFALLYLGFLGAGMKRANLSIKRNINGSGWIFFGASFLCTVILKKFLAQTGDYIGSGRSLGEYISIFGSGFIERTLIGIRGMGTYAFGYEWNFLWCFFAAGMLYHFTHPARRRFSFMPAAAVLLMMSAYLIVIQTSPHPLVWQIQTAMNRLLLHLCGLAVLFTFETFSGRTRESDR